ncbi:MAG: stage III sporulation protein AE [Candidatus Merdivicinus sp.]|jgi:stage III sporulation protein AE
MKRFAAALFFWLLLSCLFVPYASAAENDISQQAEDQLAKSGIQELIPLIPESGEEVAEDELLQNGDLSNWTFEQTFSWILNAFRSKISTPFQLAGTLCGILLLSALLNSFGGGIKSNGCSEAFTTASALCISAALVTQVVPLIQEAARTIDEMTTFMISFIPVFSGVVTVSGRPATAMAYQTVTFAAAQVFAQVAGNFIVPLLGIFLAVCTAGAVTDGIDVKGIAQAAKNTAGWILGFCLTIFVALLTLQSLTAGAADTVGNRTIKFVISSAIPVVGGALSEAYSSLSGCMLLVKNAAGVFGIAVMAAVFIPVLAGIGLTMLALNISAAVGDLLGETRASGMIRSVSSAVAVLGGLILCYGMMILSSTAILLWMGMPV